MTPLAPLLIVLLVAVPAAAQAPLAFEAASVKVNRSGETASRFSTPAPGRVVIINVTLRDILRNMYNVPSSLIAGGPSWMDSARFDVTAAAGRPADQQEMLAMLKTLFAERMQLAVKMEVREAPAYALVVARPDGTLGPDLKRATLDCAALNAQRLAGQPLPTLPDNRPVCGLRTRPGAFIGGGVLMPQLARNLSGFAGRPVVDATGLTGYYDLDLAWSPEPGPGDTADRTGPSLFTAVQEQLGLKLEARRVPLEMVVVERAEMPTAD